MPSRNYGLTGTEEYWKTVLSLVICIKYVRPELVRIIDNSVSHLKVAISDDPLRRILSSFYLAVGGMSVGIVSGHVFISAAIYCRGRPIICLSPGSALIQGWECAFTIINSPRLSDVGVPPCIVVMGISTLGLFLRGRVSPIWRLCKNHFWFFGGRK